MPENDFASSVFVITGAASGIGRQLALQAAAKGATVIATDRNAIELDQTRLMAEENGLRIEIRLLDVADPKAIDDFAKSTMQQLAGRKLVLVNNAGIALSSGSFHETSLEDFEGLMNINLWGTIRVTKAFYPYFFQTNKGHIVNLSSVFGLIGVGMNTAYCTSKFGVRGFTESLRMELHGTGIYTTCVHPGGIDTNIVRNAVVRESVISADMHSKAISAFEKQARTTAAKAAEAILGAIVKKKPRLLIGPDGLAIDLLSRLLPSGYTRVLVHRLKKSFGVD